MESPYSFISDLDAQLEAIPDESIVSRTIHDDERLKAVLFGFSAGQELSEHTASQPALLYFLRGQARLTLGAETLEVTAGAWAHMTAKLSHSIRAHTNVVMLLILLKDRRES
jgi:quercetin dioxygenase-like cupin family protein